MKRSKGFYVALSLAIIMLVFIVDTGMKAYAQSQRKQEILEEETFKRPEPSRPIKPEVPGVNRYQEDKVFLEYADSLYKINNKRDTIERQILKGNVKFRQAGMWMFCDSAYYYPEENSLDAFSNVRMEQGDTLFVYADKLFYDGDEHFAKLKNGPSRDKVTLINKDVTLTTDSLDYDLSIELGWYTKWGTIDDKVNTLTSLYGQYSPQTKLAEFFHDVVLVNNKDGFTMLTDTLFYSTETHIANIESKTQIQSENDTIFTNLATYYTDTGDADLLSRSLIIHRDSTGNITTLEGDSIIYDNASRISRAYMFRDPFKHSAPMVITDTAQKTTLIGGFGIYNDSTKEALATIYPLLMEYSQGDTLFLRADTIKTYIVTEMVWDGKRKTLSGYPEHEGKPVVMTDSLTGLLWIDTTYFKVRMPYADTPLQMLEKVAPSKKKEEPAKPEPQPKKSKTKAKEKKKKPVIESKDSVELIDKPGETVEIGETVDSISVAPLDSIEKIVVETADTIISLPKEESPGVEAVEVEEIEVEDINSSEFKESNEEESDEFAEDDEDEYEEEEDSRLIPDSIPHEFHVALAYHRGRFFKQDMQGVADSMVFVEKDSMLYLFRKPIVWSEERQVTGNRIDVHFNDSTTDWAYLPEFGLMSEHVEEDFYNQIYGKEIKAYFEGEGLRRMSVSGNVETIFLPQEEDSTFNRLVNAESSYMEVYLDSNRLDWLKMWPEVSGTVTPIFLVKRNQMYLQKFKWWGFLRPEREQYGDRVKWADNLGEVPDELEQYFLAPSDFGEPKTFTGTRFTPPPTSLPIWNDFPEIHNADSLAGFINPIDSLINAEPPISPPDSIDITSIPDSLMLDSPGILDAEKTETIGDIEKMDEEEAKESEEIEQQSEEIEDEVKNEDPDKGEAIIKEEETEDE